MKLEKFISIGWYMERKPYSAHTGYDSFYLHICRDLFGIIKKFAAGQKELWELDEEQCRELAWVLTSYFEDQVNGIGLWKSLTDLHRQQFGKRLPFFNKEDLGRQEAEWDILPEDIRYLLYVSYGNLFTMGGEKPVLPFGSHFFISLSQAVFDYLDAIEEVETTSYYEEFLTADPQYFIFKWKLDWLTFRSYLCSIEFNNYMQDYFSAVDEPEDESPEYLSLLMYTERDRLMIDQPSSLTGFYPADILAGALRGTEQQREEVRNLKWRVQGIFRMEGQTAEHFYFRHSATGQVLEASKRSLLIQKTLPDAPFWVASLISWNGDWHFTGTAFPFTGGQEDVARHNLQHQHLFQRHFLPYRKQVQELALQFREHAVKFFGSELVVFDSDDQLQDRLRDFSYWYHETVAMQPAGREPVVFQVPEAMRPEADLALFIPPQDGFIFIAGHRFLLEQLQAPTGFDLPDPDQEDALQMMAQEGMEAEYWWHLKREGLLGNLSRFLKCPLEDDADFEALLRIYRPRDFSPLRLPAFSVVN